MSVLEKRSMRVSKTLSMAAMACLGILTALPVPAHHSGAMFDDEQLVELTGTIKEFQWTNPHTWIQVYVEDDEGERVEWSIEWGGPNSLARAGWRPSTFPAGEQVTIQIRPMRNGEPAGGFVGARFPDGSTVGRWRESEDAN